MASKKAVYDSLHDLLVLKLQSLYDIENELIKALPRLTKGSNDKELRTAFEKHDRETQDHVRRLENALRSLGKKIRKERVEGIRGLIKDSAWVLSTIKNTEARDALLIASAQYVEHYEMAGYGAALEWSDLMGHTDVSNILKTTLEEEKNADATLTRLARGSINDKANTGMTPMEKLAG